MKKRDQVIQDVRVEHLSREDGQWVLLLRPGWGPKIIAERSIYWIAWKLSHSKPTPTIAGRFPDLVGLYCTTPPIRHRSPKPVRRNGCVVRQSDCGRYVMVEYLRVDAPQKRAWMKVTALRFTGKKCATSLDSCAKS